MASAAAITKRLSLDIGRLSGLLLVKTKLITNRSSDDNDTWFDIQAWKMWSLLHNNGGSLKSRNLNPADPRPGPGLWPRGGYDDGRARERMGLCSRA